MSEYEIELSRADPLALEVAWQGECYAMRQGSAAPVGPFSGKNHGGMDMDGRGRNGLASADAPIAELKEQLRRAASTGDVKAIRQETDVIQLAGLAAEAWSDRFRLIGSSGLCNIQDRATALLCDLRTPGLIYENGLSRRHSSFRLALVIPAFYPLIRPSVFFLPPHPWCPHVVHPDGIPNTTGLPAELQQHIRSGAGSTCWIRDGLWCAADTAQFTLRTVVYQVSRLLGGKVHCERAALNPLARDEFLALQHDGRLPLGPCLPDPRLRRADGTGGDAAAPPDPPDLRPVAEAQDPNIEWE